MATVSDASVSDKAAAIAARFLEARRQAGGFDDYPGEMPSTLVQAYAIQDRAIADWGRPVIGWKVGRVPEPYAREFGADRLAGPIFSQTRARDGEYPPMPIFSRGFAAAEAEFLLRIGRTPPEGQEHFSLDETADLIDAVHVGIEIASSPLRTINDLGPIAVISDFGNNNGLLIGPAIGNWQAGDFENWPVQTLIEGAIVGTGEAESFPDGTLGSARFLFELMAKRGIKLQPGQWISSGAVSGVHDASAWQKVEAIFDGRLRVTCSLTPEPGISDED